MNYIELYKKKNKHFNTKDWYQIQMNAIRKCLFLLYQQQQKGVTSDSYEYFQEWYIVALGGGIKPQTLPEK